MKVNVPSDDANRPPIEVSATVSWVALDDKTVLGSGMSWQVIAQGRRDESRYLAVLLSEVRGLLARPDIRRALSEGDESSSQPVLRRAIRDLVHSPQTPRDSALNALAIAAAVGKARFETLLNHYASLQVLNAEQSNLARHPLL